MKVGSKGELSDLQRSRELAQQEQARSSEISQSNALKLAKKLKAESEGSIGLGANDTVNVGLSQFINSELNPEILLADRRKRVEELKNLVAQGKYNPSSELVALAVGEEIMLEILSAGGDRGSEN